MSEPIRLRSRDQPTKFRDALAWLRAETCRLGWAPNKVTEDGTSICGRLYKVVELKEHMGSNHCLLNIDKNSRMDFEIKDLDGTGYPSILVHARFETIHTYRVYHENNYDARPVYFMKRLFEAKSAMEADAAQWIPLPLKKKGNGILSPMDWWHATMRIEAEMPNETDVDKLIAALAITPLWAAGINRNA